MSVLLARRAQAGAALLLALATALAALAVHALKSRLAPDSLGILHTALQYLFFQALGVLALGSAAAAAASPASGAGPIRALGAALYLILVGCVLFSGSLIALALGAPRGLGVLTPLGGVCLIVGWTMAAVSLWRQARQAVP